MWDVVGGLTGLVAVTPALWLLYVGRRERLRSQAEQVTAWSVREVRSDEGGIETPPSGVVVVNTSSSEVRDLAVKVRSQVAGEEVVGKRYNAIAPGSYYLKYDDGTWSAPSALSAEGGYLSLSNVDSSGKVETISMLPITEVPPDQSVALLRFRTSNGRRWVRLAGGEVEPEYLVEGLPGSTQGRRFQRLRWELARGWRRRWNPQLRDDLAAVEADISEWNKEFDRTQSIPATRPDFAPRVSPESNVVAALLRRSLATLFEPGPQGERELLMSSVPQRENPHHLKRVTVDIAKGTALPPTVVAAQATASPGRSLVFLTNADTPRTDVYYFSVDTHGSLPAEFFFGDTRKGFKAENANLAKAFVREAETRGHPGGGTVESWRGHEDELMAAIGAVITAHEGTRSAVRHQ